MTAGVTAALRITIRSVYDGDGVVSIASPLAGGGVARTRFWKDSLLIFSASEDGDTIFWLGQLHPTRIGGPYLIVGGPYRGQGGTWETQQDSGPPLPLWSFGERPFPDSIDLAVAFEPFSLVGRAARREATTAPNGQGHFGEFLGILVLLGFAYRIVSVVALVPFGILWMVTRHFQPESSTLHSLLLNQVFQCLVYAGLIGLMTVGYTHQRAVAHPWVYAVSGFVLLFLSLGSNAASQGHANADPLHMFQTPEESAAATGAGAGAILGLVFYIVVYCWPHAVSLIPGLVAFVAWTIRTADWLVGFWIVRIILALTVMSYVVNVGLAALVGGVTLAWFALSKVWRAVTGSSVTPRDGAA